jgi:uncharacterized protein YqgQ
MIASNKEEIALLQLQIKQQEKLFDKSMVENKEFAKAKLIFHELKRMLDRLDELTGNTVVSHTVNHQ